MANYILDKNVHRTVNVGLQWHLANDVQVTYKTTGTPNPPQLEIVIGANTFYVDCPGIKMPENMDCPIKTKMDPNNQFSVKLDDTIPVYTVGHELTDPQNPDVSFYVIKGKKLADGTESDYAFFSANAIAADAASGTAATPAVAATMITLDGPGSKVPPTVGADVKFGSHVQETDSLEHA